MPAITSLKTKKQVPGIVSIQKTTPRQKELLHPYSNSRIAAVGWCPTWGVVSAQKRYNTTARAMALEAGETMHEVFAITRIWQLRHIQNLPKHAEESAKRIFGMKRWKAILKEAGGFGATREDLLELAFSTLHTSDWFDEPSDTVRTMNNMELASINYIDERLPHMENWPIYVENKDDPRCLVGIEQHFDIVVLYDNGRYIRYIGTIDGLVEKTARRELYLDENKTAARLDTGWRSSFDMSMQITGYCAASTSVFGRLVLRSRVTGVKIKPTKSGEDTYTLEPVQRTQESIQTWGRWLLDGVTRYEEWKDDYEHAPRYTHACNRYFRPCALLPFCSDSVEGRKETWSQMVEADKSPSERAVMEI
jgi:hypothetical protein